MQAVRDKVVSNLASSLEKAASELKREGHSQGLPDAPAVARAVEQALQKHFGTPAGYFTLPTSAALWFPVRLEPSFPSTSLGVSSHGACMVCWMSQNTHDCWMIVRLVTLSAGVKSPPPVVLACCPESSPLMVASPLRPITPMQPWSAYILYRGCPPMSVCTLTKQSLARLHRLHLPHDLTTFGTEGGEAPYLHFLTALPQAHRTSCRKDIVPTLCFWFCPQLTGQDVNMILWLQFLRLCRQHTGQKANAIHPLTKAGGACT